MGEPNTGVEVEGRREALFREAEEAALEIARKKAIYLMASAAALNAKKAYDAAVFREMRADRALRTALGVP